MIIKEVLIITWTFTSSFLLLSIMIALLFHRICYISKMIFADTWYLNEMRRALSIKEIALNILLYWFNVKSLPKISLDVLSNLCVTLWTHSIKHACYPPTIWNYPFNKLFFPLCFAFKRRYNIIIYQYKDMPYYEQ